MPRLPARPAVHARHSRRRARGPVEDQGQKRVGHDRKGRRGRPARPVRRMDHRLDQPRAHAAVAVQIPAESGGAVRIRAARSRACRFDGPRTMRHASSANKPARCA